MQPLIKDFFKQSLRLAGAYPARATPKSRIVNLMRGLFPATTDKKLIRLGPKGDGGYLVPDDLTGIEACFSPGVSIVSGFEKDCADRGMKVFLADYSVDGPAEEHSSFNFIKKYIGAVEEGEFITFDHWVTGSPVDQHTDLLIQMDIEGFEYETILSMSSSLLKRSRILVVEFHGLHELWNDGFFRFASRAFERLLLGHTCVHIHPNNVHPPSCVGSLTIHPTMEFTFIRNDRIKKTGFASAFPHPLDFDNTGCEPAFLPECWRKKI